MPISILPRAVKNQIKAIRRRLYYVRNIKDRDEQLRLCKAELDEVFPEFRRQYQEQAWDYAVLQVLTDPLEQRVTPEPIDLWRGDGYFHPIVDLFWRVTDENGKAIDFVSADDAKDYMEELQDDGQFAGIEKARVVRSVAHADLKLDEARQVGQRKDQNIIAAVAERDRWTTYFRIIEPILIRNPSWTWGQAVDWLETQGPLPDLG
jgi:hypothetical protein